MSTRTAERFDLGDVILDSGQVLHQGNLVYQTYGELAPDRSNAILYPTFFGGTHLENEWLIGAGRALDPARWFVIVPNLIGNGVSTSPSNAIGPDAGRGFPLVTFRDQVRVQHRLVVERFGIERLQAVVGWSMGACQAFQWAVSYPDMVERILPFCGSARTSEHNHVFLDGVDAAIRADQRFADGDYTSQPLAGLRAAAIVYAGWGFSQPFYRERGYRELGFDSREDFIAGFWIRMFTENRDANDLLSMIRTWKSGDVGAGPFGGDLAGALGSIRARTIVLAAERDLYFCAEDAATDAAAIPGADFRVIPGIWGHSGGAGLHEPDNAVVDAALAELLAG